MNLVFEPCSISQLEDLIQISRKTFTDAFEKQNNPEDFKTYQDQAFSKERLEEELKNEDSYFYFVRLEDKVVAYFKLNKGTAQTDIRTNSALEIERIYVLQDYQGLGLGHMMLNEIKKIARAEKKEYLWLGVWEENLAAIRFYEKNGFSKFGMHPYYIGKDKQMDWLMRFDLITLTG